LLVKEERKYGRRNGKVRKRERKEENFVNCLVSCSDLQFLMFVLNKWGILIRFLLVKPIVLQLAKKFLSFATCGGFVTTFARDLDTLVCRIKPFHILPHYLVLNYFDITVLCSCPSVSPNIRTKTQLPRVLHASPNSPFLF
jgi:hypothetical protein